MLVDHLELSELAVVVGHDIGVMVAVAYALRYRDAVGSLVYGESPVPDTDLYERVKATMPVFHFTFHVVFDLPETLVAGRER